MSKNILIIDAGSSKSDMEIYTDSGKTSCGNDNTPKGLLGSLFD